MKMQKKPHFGIRIFLEKENFFLELQDHGIPEQQNVNQQLLKMQMRQELIWLQQMMYIIPMQKMPSHMISCSASRPVRNWQIRIVCVMRAVSIM